MNPPKAVSRNWPRRVPRATFTSLSVREPKRPLDGLEAGLLAQWVNQRICARRKINPPKSSQTDAEGKPVPTLVPNPPSLTVTQRNLLSQIPCRKVLIGNGG